MPTYDPKKTTMQEAVERCGLSFVPLRQPSPYRLKLSDGFLSNGFDIFEHLRNNYGLTPVSEEEC